FISLDEPPLTDMLGSSDGNLEDPSSWFEGEDEPGDMKSVELKAVKVGPRTDTTSMMIPIDVVNQVIEEARARGDLDWLDKGDDEDEAVSVSEPTGDGSSATGEGQLGALGPEDNSQVTTPGPSLNGPQDPTPSANEMAPPVTDEPDPHPATAGRGHLVWIVLVLLAIGLLALLLAT